LPLAHPSLLIRHSHRLQILRRRTGIVQPLPQQRAAIDDVDGELAVLLFDGSVHMAKIHWYEAAGIGRKEFKIKHLF
jgi:hypothetical protein